MDIAGEFHLIEKDGKLFLEYHHSKYHPLPQSQSPSSSDKTIINNHISQSLFLCPQARYFVASRNALGLYFLFPIISSPVYLFSTRDHAANHSVLPLFWCNNKDFEGDDGCGQCGVSNFGTDYYLYVYCNKKFHRECVQSPLKINSPYHPEHSLHLYHHFNISDTECLCCENITNFQIYYCGICRVFMHPVCAMKPIPFVIDLPKRHNHPLTFFPRQSSLTCNVCGLLRKFCSTYICVKCNFVAHKDCMYFPRIIKISRHCHRISYSSALRSGEWFCGVCRQIIETNYGAYTCDKCCDYYVVHSICALGKDVCDGEDLEGVPEEDDITLGVESFDVISEGVILHFLHDHHLYLQVSILYDENKFCQACVLPIFEGNIYSCTECDFILHVECANSCRKLQHALHPHPLTLNIVSPYGNGYYDCDACGRSCSGFIYECHLNECDFSLDIRCASISEPVDYQGHDHPLYLALIQNEELRCHLCELTCFKQLNCIICNFVICIECTTLPSKVRYKHDIHFLRVLWGKEVCEKSWCEVCEHDLRDTNTKVVYWCDECCITVHIQCLLGDYPYLKHSQIYDLNRFTRSKFFPKAILLDHYATTAKTVVTTKYI